MKPKPKMHPFDRAIYLVCSTLLWAAGIFVGAPILWSILKGIWLGFHAR